MTIPHKEAALALADEASEEARGDRRRQHAHVRRRPHPRRQHRRARAWWPRSAPVEGKTALVLGAGGSARAAVWALLHAGARDVMVWNRTPEPAREALCAELGGRAVMEPEPADLLVNCTSVGLDASDETFKELPIEADGLGNYCALVDLVYAESDDDPPEGRDEAAA